MSHWQSKAVITYNDRLFSKYIRLRDGGCMYKVRCYGYAEFNQLHNSHYFGRGRKGTRFDPENCDAACARCHEFVHGPGGKEWLDEFKLAQLGEKRLALLTLRANTPTKIDEVLTRLYIKQLLKEVSTRSLE